MVWKADEEEGWIIDEGSLEICDIVDSAGSGGAKFDSGFRGC